MSANPPKKNLLQRNAGTVLRSIRNRYRYMVYFGHHAGWIVSVGLVSLLAGYLWTGTVLQTAAFGPLTSFFYLGLLPVAIAMVFAVFGHVRKVLGHPPPSPPKDDPALFERHGGKDFWLQRHRIEKVWLAFVVCALLLAVNWLWPGLSR
ncbi:MAG: hypothetical protein AAFO70_01940 [Pseudomonadota bacterium]